MDVGWSSSDNGNPNHCTKEEWACPVAKDVYCQSEWGSSNGYSAYLGTGIWTGRADCTTNVDGKGVHVNLESVEAFVPKGPSLRINRIVF